LISYRNLSGHSGVSEYVTGKDFIRVRFVRSWTIYRYTYENSGPMHVEEMKRCAVAGRGLSTYIAENKSDLQPDRE